MDPRLFWRMQLSLQPLPDGRAFTAIKSLFETGELQPIFNEIGAIAYRWGCVWYLGFEFDYSAEMVVVNGIWGGSKLDVDRGPGVFYAWLSQCAEHFKTLRQLAALIEPSSGNVAAIPLYGMVLPPPKQ